MSVKEKLIKYYVDEAWNIAIRNDITNIEKVRILNTIRYQDIPTIKFMDEIGVWE